MYFKIPKFTSTYIKRNVSFVCQIYVVIIINYTFATYPIRTGRSNNYLKFRFSLFLLQKISSVFEISEGKTKADVLWHRRCSFRMDHKVEVAPITIILVHCEYNANSPNFTDKSYKIHRAVSQYAGLSEKNIPNCLVFFCLKTILSENAP